MRSQASWELVLSEKRVLFYKKKFKLNVLNLEIIHKSHSRKDVSV